MNNQPLPPMNEIGGNTEVIVKYSGSLEPLAELLGARYEELGGGYAIITIAASDAERLTGFPGIEYAEYPRELYFSLDGRPGFDCVERFRRNSSPGLSGAGTALAIIDSGIDFTLPDFRNPDGTTKILFLWDQTLPGDPPEGFLKGSEFTRSEIDDALASDYPTAVIPSIDYAGHGTAVSGIAASVAPGAALIIVKLGSGSARTTDVMRAFSYAIRKSASLSLPLSVNLSYGTNDGSHTGETLFENYISEISGVGRTVVTVAAGNEGAAGHHYSARLSSGEERRADFTVASRRDFFITLWKNYTDDISFSLISPDGSRSAFVSQGTRSEIFSPGNTTVNMIYGEPTVFSVLQQVFFSFSQTGGSARGIWRLVIKAGNIVDGRLDAWLPTVEEVTADTRFLTADENLTLTIPSTVDRVISVGGYDARSRTFAAFSGRGGEDGPIKPDLVAPATDLTAPTVGGGETLVSGTSFAAPLVAGSAALLMEWGIVRGGDPFLYGEKVKAVLRRSAERQRFISYPNNLWGYGELCPEIT